MVRGLHARRDRTRLRGAGASGTIARQEAQWLLSRQDRRRPRLARDHPGQALGACRRDGDRHRQDLDEPRHLRGPRLRLRPLRCRRRAHRADQRYYALHRHLRATGALHHAPARRDHAAGRRLHDQRSVRGRHPQLRHRAHQANFLGGPSLRLRHLGRALERGGRRGAGQHLADRDRDLSGGRALPRHPGVPGRRDHRRRDRADPRERALARAIPRRLKRRPRGRAHRRDTAPRDHRPLRRSLGEGHLRPHPGDQRAPEPGRGGSTPRRRLRGGGLDRRRRHLRRALPRRGRRAHPRRHGHLRLHRHQPHGQGADQLRLRRPRFCGQDRLQVAGGPAGAVERRLVPPGEPGLPAGHRVHGPKAGPHRLVLRGLGPRLRARLEGLGPTSRPSASARAPT